MRVRLTLKQERFVTEYLRTGKPGQAAEAAGYSKRSAPMRASELFRKPHVQAAIQAELRKLREEGIMPLREACERLSAIGRSSILDFLNDDGSINVRNVERAQAVQSYTVKPDGTTEIKLRDPVQAITQVCNLTGQTPAARIDARHLVGLVPGDGSDSEPGQLLDEAETVRRIEALRLVRQAVKALPEKIGRHHIDGHK